MFAGTVVARSRQQDIICYQIRPDVVAQLTGDVYGFGGLEEGIIPLGARVCCSYGPPYLALVLMNFITIMEWWIDPALI